MRLKKNRNYEKLESTKDSFLARGITLLLVWIVFSVFGIFPTYFSFPFIDQAMLSIYNGTSDHVYAYENVMDALFGNGNLHLSDKQANLIGEDGNVLLVPHPEEKNYTAFLFEKRKDAKV